MTDFFVTYQPLLSQILISSLLALSMFIWLRSGMISFATAGIMAVGSYVSAITSTTYQFPFWLSAVLAILAAMALALILGRVLLKLQHIHFALATLAFSELIRLLTLNWDSVTLGALGISGIPPVTKLWQLILSVVIASYVMARLSGKSKYGRALALMREDQLLAKTMGIYTNWYTVLIFVIGSVPTALAGVYQAHFNMYISPDQYGFPLMLSVLMMTIVGGRSRWIGPILGAFLISILPEVLRISKHYILLLNWLILLAVMIFLPQGLVSVKFHIRKSSGSSKTAAIDPEAETEINSNKLVKRILPAFSRHLGNKGKHLLVLEGINLKFGGIEVLNNVTCSVQEGEVLGIIGPNGAGKTSLLNVISGVVSPSAGQLFWEGRDVTRLRPDQLAQIGMSRTYQNIRLIKDMTVFDNVLIGAHQSLGYGLIGTLLKNRPYKEAELKAESETTSMLQWLGLEGLAKTPAGSLAYGLQRRVEVARALMSHPRLLLLDEPTSGMNETESREFGELVTHLRDAGMTIVLVEHHVPMVTKVCDNVLVINFGKTIAYGPPARIQSNPEVIEAYLGADYTAKEVASSARS